MRHLFFSDPEPLPALSRPTVLRIGLLFAPTAFLLLLLRLIQHATLATPGQPAIGSLLTGPAPPLFFVLFVTISLGLWATHTWPFIRAVWLSAGTVLLGAGLTIWASILLPPWLTGWLTREAFEVVRWDLLVMLFLTLAFALWLEYARGWRRTLGLGLLHVLVPLLILLPLFELSVIRTMGTALDGSMLLYSIRHLNELTPVIASEAGPVQVGLLLLPLVITLAPLAVLRRSAARARMAEPPAWSLKKTGRVVGAALPLAALLALPPSATLPPTHRTISYAGMAHSFLEAAPWEPDRLADHVDPTALPFDTRHLRFVPTDSTRHLNVVVVILESVRSRSTTPYEPGLATTPFLNALARQALLVEQMYAVVSYTNKALIPILAGVYPELSRENVEATPGAFPAAGLPHLLRPHGYRTAFFTPAKMSFERKDQILHNLGFETIRGDAAYLKEGFHVTNYFGYEDRVMLAPSMAWIDEVTARGEPFFLSYLTLSTHHPYETPPTFRKKPFADDPRLNDYLNAMHYTDAFLEDLFDAFARRDLLASTLFVIVGDHGEAFGEHGELLHGDVLWDEAIHTPALLYNPVLFPHAGRIAGNRSQVDVLPTIAEVLGYRIEGGSYPGVSLLQPVPDGRVVYHSARHGNQALALRQDSLKFFYYDRRRPMQVFDIHNDPFERRDLAAQLDPDVLKSVELNLLLWRRGVQQIYHTSKPRAEQLAAR